MIWRELFYAAPYILLLSHLLFSFSFHVFSHSLKTAMYSYCPSCDEECEATSSSTICLTCGDDLVAAPPSASNNSSSGGAQQRSNEAAATGVTFSTRGFAQLLANTTPTEANVNALLPFMTQINRGTGQDNGDISDIQDLLPPEALNPQSGTSRHRPVSEKILKGLKRTVLTRQSAELFEAHLCLYRPRSIADISPSMEGESISFNAVLGEFAMQYKNNEQKRIHSKTAALVICSPRTTKGGLSSETLAEIANLRQHRIPFVAYVERGDGITFVQKALACQRAGQVECTNVSLCIGVVVGNTTTGGNEIWPYTMQDNKNESQEFGLKVPVVMIRRDDGIKLVKFAAESATSDQQYTPCQIEIDAKEAHTCPVCTDSYEPGATIIQLPSCMHVFHEYCAIAWLSKHNTCPYCRKELPTDDEDYERERRRRETSESNAGGAGSSGARHFYG
ncbi:hypothetical protein ACHAXM_010412 [Skeletonema potamos]